MSMKQINKNTRRAKIYKRYLIVSIIIGSIMVFVTGKEYIEKNIPKELTAAYNSSKDYDSGINYEYDVKSASAQINGSDTKIYACGMPVGLYLHTDGIMIIDYAGFESIDGNKVTPLKNKVKKGDYIVKVNGKKVDSKQEVIDLVEKSNGETIELTIKRNDEEITEKVKPVKNKNGIYKIGLWVRDDTQGLGTITFVTSNGIFGALGHGISDLDTGEMVTSFSGNLYYANIWGIKKGKIGEPGGFCGSIDYNEENKVGTITKNCETGLFGNVDLKKIDVENFKEVSVAKTDEVKCGKAKIIIYKDGRYNEYDININRVRRRANQNKNLVIEVVDKKLLSKTNGIIQGMSGAPIIQNDKLIGAVTHVLINDPHQGYGSLISNMIQ